MRQVRPIHTSPLHTLHAVTAAVLVLTTGCGAGRTANRMVATGARLLASRGSDAGGFSVLAAATGAAEHVAVDAPVGAGYRASVAVGGNADGPAGEGRLTAEMGGHWDPTLGLVPGRLHTIHMRIGVDALFETSPYQSFRYVEAPSLSAGYTFHGRDTNTYADSMHIHVGPRAAFAWAGVVDDGVHAAALGFAPDVGGEALFAGEAVWLHATYRAFLGKERVDMFEASGCFARTFAACVETRVLTLPWATRDGVITTLYVGLTLGVGLSTGIGP